eukprot:6665516-Prymnesium_polylepis.1
MDFSKHDGADPTLDPSYDGHSELPIANKAELGELRCGAPSFAAGTPHAHASCARCVRDKQVWAFAAATLHGHSDGVCRYLGSGEFCSVYASELKGQKVAIKKLKP